MGKSRQPASHRRLWQPGAGHGRPSRVQYGLAKCTDHIQHAGVHLGIGQYRIHDVQHHCTSQLQELSLELLHFIGYGSGGVPSWPNAANGANFANATSNHPGGVNVLFADGSVKFIKDSIAMNIWWALGMRNGGEVVSADSY